MKLNTQNIVLIGGAAVLGYYLAPQKVKDKIQDIMPSGGVGVNLSDLIGNIGGFGGGVIPNFNLDFDLSDIFPEGSFITDIIPEDFSEIPQAILDETVPGYRTIRKITPEAIQDSAARGVGIYGRQIVGTALSGRRVIPFVPFQRAAQRILAPKVAKAVGLGAPRVAARLAPRVGARVATRVGAAVATRVATRGIPIVGWGLLGVDVFSDILRVFGINMPEWLGFSGMVSPFTGENPIESWARGALVPTDMGSATPQTLVSLPYANQLSLVEGSTGVNREQQSFPTGVYYAPSAPTKGASKAAGKAGAVGMTPAKWTPPSLPTPSARWSLV